MFGIGFLTRLWKSKMDPTALLLLEHITPQQAAILDHLTGHHTVFPEFRRLFFTGGYLWGERDSAPWETPTKIVRIVRIVPEDLFMSFWESLKEIAKLNDLEREDADAALREKIQRE